MYYGQSLSTGGGSTDPMDKILHLNYFPTKTDGFFIEAGANDGLFLSSCKFFEDIGWKGINIEPSKSLFNSLIINRPNSINLNIALLDKETEVEFEEVDFDNGGFSRIKDVRSAYYDSFFKLAVENSYKIKTQTYAKLIQDLNIPKVDLFVLDVEGFECEVINGMKGTSILPWLLCIEWTQCGLEKLSSLLFDNYLLDWNDSLNAIFMRRK